MNKIDHLINLLTEAIDMDIKPNTRLVEELIEDLEYKLDLYESHKE